MNNYTNSSLISLTNLSPNRNSPRNQVISKITIHHFAGDSTIEGVSDFLANPARQASYNYGIGSDGRIVLIVEERDRCWASSSRENDHRAIVIGVANNGGKPMWPVSDTAFDTLIDLCVDICRRNPSITQRDDKPGLWYDGTANGSLTRHNMFSNQTCPGPFLQSRFPEICRLVNKRLEMDLDYSFDEENLAAHNLPAQPSVRVSNFINLAPAVAAEKILELVKPNGLATDIFPSVKAAQMILESGYLRSELAQQANNGYGMKIRLSGNTWPGSSWDGISSHAVLTGEQNPDGSKFNIVAEFRRYPDIMDSVEDHSAYLLGAMNGRMLRFLGVADAADYREQITIIWNGGYATDINYVDRVCDIIARFGLDKYDHEATIVQVRNALDRLAEQGIINSPDYWLANFRSIQYLDRLIINMGNANFGAAENGSIQNINQALDRLVFSGVISSPDYWLANHSKVEWLDTLIINAAGRL